MEYDLLGWPPDGPRLRLDHRRFSYAGKFVMTNTGKAVVQETTDDGANSAGCDPGTGTGRGVVAAAAFNADRTDDNVLWIRYVTVRRDRRGEGIGARLAAFVVVRGREQGFERVRIAVNNPFAYQALYRAGFGFTGAETGLAELVLEHPTDRSEEVYQEGLDLFRARDLSGEERAFLREKTGAPPPETVDSEYSF